MPFSMFEPPQSSKLDHLVFCRPELAIRDILQAIIKTRPSVK